MKIPKRINDIIEELKDQYLRKIDVIVLGL